LRPEVCSLGGNAPDQAHQELDVNLGRIKTPFGPSEEMNESVYSPSIEV
jgi:hypothetical protein